MKGKLQAIDIIGLVAITLGILFLDSAIRVRAPLETLKGIISGKGIPKPGSAKTVSNTTPTPTNPPSNNDVQSV